MWTVSQIIWGILLLILSVKDIRKREVPTWLVVSGGILAVLCKVLEQAVNDIPGMLVGAAIGTLFLLVSRITREALGYGDSMLIVGLGLYLGLWKMLYLLVIAFFSAAVFSMAGIIIKRFTRKTTIPFIPFLAVGYLGVWVL